MAKRRLNKKVAFIGSIVFAFFVLFAIALVLYLSRNPAEFIKDGDAALQAARQTTQEQVKESEYSRAERNYLKARGLARTDELKVEILFKLVDVYLETEQWHKVLRSWNGILNITPRDIKARYGRLKYLYIMADSSPSVQIWQEIASVSSEFIEIADEGSLLEEDLDKWESFEVEQSPYLGKSLGAHLYMVLGRANLSLASIGAVTEPEELLNKAIDDLQRAREFEQENVDIYWYLAQAEIARGEILAARGNPEERKKAYQQAKDYLDEGIVKAENKVQAHINLLRLKRNQADTPDEVELLRPEFLEFVEKFYSDAEAYYELSQFYQVFPREFDKAVEASEKAIELDKKNVTYAINAANLNYRYFSIYGQQLRLHRAMEIANGALDFPGSLETTGPKSFANRRSRLALYFFLANCYIEQLLKPAEESEQLQRQQWLASAEEAVHQIEQILGSGEDPHVVQWQGMLELARGNEQAVRKLYGAYVQLQASGIETSPPSFLRSSYAQLSYTLAQYFRETSEIGATVRFLSSALRAGIVVSNPETLLDYAETTLQLGQLTMTISNLDLYDKNFGANDRSRKLRIRAYINANQFEDAEKELAKSSLDELDEIQLKLAMAQGRIVQIQKDISRRQVQRTFQESLAISEEGESGLLESSLFSESAGEDLLVEGEDELLVRELGNYRQSLFGLAEQLLKTKPEAIEESSFVTICGNYITAGQLQKAQELVNSFLEYSPDSVMAKYYKAVLSEPEPASISSERNLEIEQDVISGISDLPERWLNLGMFYQRNNKLEEAAELFTRLLQLDSWLREDGVIERPDFEQAERTLIQLQVAAGNLFNIVLDRQDWELAEKIADIARVGNLDECEGHYFAARLAAAQKQYDEALAGIEKGLSLRPVFSHGYMLRSTINSALGNETAAIEDAREAVLLNPREPSLARRLAFVFYQRNFRIGNNVTVEQESETRRALETAVVMNPGDNELLSLYARYISLREPRRALAIRQYLQQRTPNSQNAVLLGSLAMNMAVNERDAETKEALFEVAGAALEQALKLKPQDNSVLATYSELYRIRGQKDKARELLEKTGKKQLLWHYYYKEGRFSDANRVLKQLYQDDPEDINSVKALLLLSKVTSDSDAVKQYSEEILQLEDSIDNQLLQIQTFLEVGLVKDSELKLQSFIERHPDEPGGRLLEGWLMMRQGRLKDSLSAVNRYLQSNQNNATAWQLRAKIDFLRSDYSQAIIDYGKSISLLDNPSVIISLAKTYLRAGRGQEAITELQKALSNPQISNQARLLLEYGYERLGRKEALRRFYDSTLRELPDNDYWHFRAAAFAMQEGDFARAADLYKKAWQISTAQSRASAVALDGYLGALLLDGKLDAVFEEASKYTNGQFSAVAFFRMAEAKLQLGDRANAIEYCRNAIEMADADKILSSGVVERMSTLLGQNEVLQYCREKLESEPLSETANLAMFNLKKLSGEYNKALDYIDKCLDILGPENPRRLPYTIEKAGILQLAYMKTSDNNYLTRVIQEYESLLSKMPNNTNVLNNMAFLLAEANERLSEALEYARRAYEVKPNSPNILDTYAYVLFKNGKLEQAAELLQAALQHYEDGQVPVSADVYEHLGMIKEKLGSEKEALSAYQLASEMPGLSEKSVERIKSAIERVSQEVGDD